MRRRTPRPLGIFLILLLLTALVAAPRIVMEMRTWPHIPTRGTMLWAFGVPVSYQTCGFHTGQDWFAAIGTPIYAVADGTVVHVGPMWLSGPDVGRGDFTVILHHIDENEDEYYTTYGHNSVSLVSPGESVERGQKIAEVGDEGYSPRPHLHLEKVAAPFTGDWQQPFVGCEGYRDPGNRWSPF
jgi:septal ring factor EnvC (AmiA/AmiB activator)